jgi:hypothetical protein
MQYMVVDTIRYSFRLRREAVFRLTYCVTEGPTPGMDRWFLVGQEEDEWQDVAEAKRRIAWYQNARTTLIA